MVGRTFKSSYYYLSQCGYTCAIKCLNEEWQAVPRHSFLRSLMLESTGVLEAIKSETTSWKERKKWKERKTVKCLIIIKDGWNLGKDCDSSAELVISCIYGGMMLRALFVVDAVFFYSASNLRDYTWAIHHQCKQMFFNVLSRVNSRNFHNICDNVNSSLCWDFLHTLYSLLLDHWAVFSKEEHKTERRAKICPVTLQHDENLPLSYSSADPPEFDLSV